MNLETIRYEVDGRLARIELNRPDRLNAINREMPRELRRAVEEANRDDRVHAIILSGAGRAFCAGYDLQEFAEQEGPESGTQEMPWDPLKDYQFMGNDAECFMSLWRGLKPVICRIQGYGGRRRKQHRPVCRHHYHGGDREDRIPAGPRLGLPDNRPCGCTGSAPSRRSVSC